MNGNVIFMDETKKSLQVVKEKFRNMANEYDVLACKMRNFSDYAYFYAIYDQCPIQMCIDEMERSIGRYQQLYSNNQEQEIAVNYCTNYIKKLSNILSELPNYPERAIPSEDLTSKLWKLQCTAYQILKQIGFDGLAAVDVSPVNGTFDSAGMYVTNHDKILIPSKTLQEYSEKTIIEVLLHEYIHAWCNRRFGRYCSEVCDDDSVIFGMMINRLNKKLRLKGMDYHVVQNGLREYYSVNWHRTAYRKLTDCRKSMSTICCESLDVIDAYKEKYGTIKVLGGEGYELFHEMLRG